MTERPERVWPVVLVMVFLAVGSVVGILWAVADLFRSDNPRTSISQRQADCAEAGGAPVVIGYGHGTYRVVCFRTDAVLWTDSEFQSKEPDHD